MTHFDAVYPNRVLAIRGRDRIIELDHVLHTHPLTGSSHHGGIVQQRVAPILAIRRRSHAHPIVVVVKLSAPQPSSSFRRTARSLPSANSCSRCPKQCAPDGSRFNGTHSIAATNSTSIPSPRARLSPGRDVRRG